MVEGVSKDDSPHRDIRHDDLRSLSRMVGTGYRAQGAALESGATVAKGVFDLRQIRPGFLLHASDARYERTVTTRLVKQRSLNLSVVLEGQWQATLGGTTLSCGGAGARAMAFVVAEADVWQKHSQRGGHARMVNVMVSPEWLEGSGLDGSDLSAASIGDLSRRHRWHGQWQPTHRVLALAHQVLGRQVHVGPLQRLYLESRAIEIVVECLSLLTGDGSASGNSIGPPADHSRMQMVRDRLNDGWGEIPSLADLAREAGVSTRTLQRQFAAVHGLSVVEYARRRRLILARELLEREDATVAQAAHRAGYAHAANFATAFKRHFGVLPRQVRTRL